MGAVLLAAALAAYNAAANRWPPFHTRAYLPSNLVAGGIVLWVGLGWFGLSREQIGLTGDGLALGVLLALPVLVVIAGLWAHPRTRPRLADARYADTGARAAAFVALVRVPLGTALFEETLFRGVLFAAFLGEGTVHASVATSVAFGLWHLEPTRLMVRANRPDASRARVMRGVVAGVLLTAAAGALFSWLRVLGGGIAAPAAFHALVNAAGAIAAIGAHRRG